MTGRHAFVLGGVVFALLACEAWIHVSAQHVACVSGEVQTSSSLSLSETPLLELLAGVAVGWMVRVLWLVVSSRRSLRHLPLLTMPTELTEAIGRTGVQDVVCVDSSASHAFCAEARRPRIFITHELVRQLQPQELDAVLLHEEHHRRRRDPLRYLLRRSAADILFFVPLLQWWAEYAGQSAELQADRTVLGQLGAKPLARALLTVTASPSSPPSAGFHGSMELRVAQVLGDGVRRRSPTMRTLITSLIGLAIAGQVAWCASLVPTILHQTGL